MEMMKTLAAELSLSVDQVEKTVALIDETLITAAGNSGSAFFSSSIQSRTACVRKNGP